MLTHEKRAVLSLSLIMSFRMLGMFMVLPVFSVYAMHLKAATPLRIGIALGIYGLTQACLQIPMGNLSDKIGRKKVISCGLLLFALGSLVCAFAHSINGIIIGRAIQGAGAIGSTVLAMTADLTPDENRSKAMAILGMTIGLSFALALVAGPVINHYFQLQGIFIATFLLAIVAILLLYTVTPEPPAIFSESITRYHNKQTSAALKNPQLLRLNLGIFSLHAILTATFIAVPVMLAHKIQLAPLQQTALYLVVLGVAFMLMLPFIIVGEKKRRLKAFLIAAISLLMLCELMLATQPQSIILIAVILTLFFSGFTFLEASLPSLVSKIAPLKRKGTAMGIYSGAQFMGIFLGGSLGGLLFQHFQISGVFMFCTVVAFIWLLAAIFMAQPPYLSTSVMSLNNNSIDHIEKIKQYLANENGVADFIISQDESLVYIKADNKIITKDQLRKLLNRCNLDS